MLVTHHWQWNCTVTLCLYSYFYFCEEWRAGEFILTQCCKNDSFCSFFLMWTSMYEHVNNTYSVFGNLGHPVMMSNNLITSRNYEESKVCESLCCHAAEPSTLETSSSCFSTWSLIISVWSEQSEQHISVQIDLWIYWSDASTQRDCYWRMEQIKTRLNPQQIHSFYSFHVKRYLHRRQKCNRKKPWLAL